MATSTTAMLREIRQASQSGWSGLVKRLEQSQAPDIVKVEWDVVYDQLGHDIYVQGIATALHADTYLLQIWSMDQHPGIWIPELRPWAASVVEFESSQRVSSARFGLIDSKWRPEDSGQQYQAVVWGYANREGNQVQFGPFTKSFTYP